MRTLAAWLERGAVWIALLAVIVGAEWLREPAPLAAGVLAAIALAAGLGAVHAGARARLTALGLGLLAGAVVTGQLRLHRVERQWPEERERRVTAASRRLNSELGAARREVDSLAGRSLLWTRGNQGAAFSALADLLPGGGAEFAVAILEPTGVPWAWAGRHRLVPRPEGDPLSVRFTPFYVLLESRQRTEAGRTVLATVLLWADSAVPRPDRSLGARLAREAGVGLHFLPPGAPPPAGEIFDYTQPTTAGERLLFSVSVTPPDQSVVRDQLSAATARWAALTLGVLLLISLLAAPHAGARFLLLAGLVWAVCRSPLGAALGFEDLFSPATFFRRALRPFTLSAGHLLVTSSVLLAAGAWLLERRVPRRWWTAGVGVLLLIGAPYLVSELSRGIVPPVSGVPDRLWLEWQVTLTLATSALILLAGAWLRGSVAAGDRRIWVVAGAGIAVVAGSLGAVLWEPPMGWPAWYPFLWVPALLLATLPAPRWVTVSGVAVVAGTAAALVTWSAELTGRIRAAQRDLDRLGESVDVLAEPYLERFGDQVRESPEPETGSALFVLWRVSALAGQEFPARLGLWEASGSRRAELPFDSLDVPAALVAAQVRSLDTLPGSRRIIPLARVPGRHTLLLQRLPSGRVLTAAVGPRSRLLAPLRLGRLLRPPPDGPPLYELSISPPFTQGLVELPPLRWRRVGTDLRTERRFRFVDGSREVHAVVERRPLSALLVRGALLVVVDALALTLLVGLATLRPASLRRRAMLWRAAHSFRVRLGVALAAFFVIPAAGFTVWGLRRLTAEADRTRDLLIATALRDAVLAAGGLLQEPEEQLEEGLAELSNRLESEFVLYSGGRLVAASAPVLRDLALVEPLLDAGSFRRLALGDELELIRSATTYIAPVRVGYRIAQAGPPGGVGILATPQLSVDWGRSQSQRELALLLLCATVAGMGAALVGARLAARTLSRPVADLGRSAQAVGHGLPLPDVAAPPIEFEQVFEAFQRMAADIRAGQEARDRARRHTAAVLANVATGVVALDREGRIVIANTRASQFLRLSLPEGEALGRVLGEGWRPVTAVVEQFLAGTGADHAEEVEVAGRTWRLQLARLEEPHGGLVLAMDDLTDVTQAARVLAWGEMARQVAHEIKNPLTPIRLGVQHLQRVRRERPERLDQALDETTTRLLGEIDRLDTIARAFSRFGLPGNLQAPLEETDLAALSAETAALYRLAADGTAVEVEGRAGRRMAARPDEVREVLGNLIENSRQAGARRIVIRMESDGFTVEDDGGGIAPELLPRIFEPRFSTTTSGAGLGLAIVQRLVEGWGAAITATSQVGQGTSMRVRWPRTLARGAD